MTSDASPVEATVGAHRPPRSVADLVVSIALLVVALVTALMTTFAGFMLVMASDSCGIVRECSTSGLTAGVGMSVIGPWVGLLGFGVWAVVRMARRRLAWWTSLAALLAAPVLWLAGAVIVWQAVGGGS